MASASRLLLIAGLLLAASCSRVEQDIIPAPTPPVYTIRAGFAGEEAGTRSRLDIGETYAKVLWTGGDAFKMYKMSTGGYSQTTYTTEDDGTEVATFTSTKRLGEDDSYTSIYPAQQYGVYKKNDDVLLRVPVPPVQTAVPGGIAEGLNLAAAWSSTQDADLQFKNLLSFVRFRLEGDAVSSLKSIIFDAGTTVAGDAALYFQEGELKFGYTSNFGTSVTYERSNTVTLSGTFVEGQDYCIAMVPASLTDGFTLTFSDGECRFIEKHSSKTLTLTRSRIVDFGTIDLGDTWGGDDQVIQYVTQTKGQKKNVVAILADGFRSEELDLFESLAKDAVDYWFSVEPYKSYKEYFTVYLCRIASNESGAGIIDENGNILTSVDNYFGSRWPEESYSNMTADEATIKSYLSSHIPEIVSGELAQNDVPAALLINDNRYGGICHIKGSGWSYAQIPYQYAGRQIRWSFPSVQAVNVQDDSEGSRQTTDAERDEMGRMVGDWKNTFLHEFGGHAYGRLTDEYWSGTSAVTAPAATPPNETGATAQAQRLPPMRAKPENSLPPKTSSRRSATKSGNAESSVRLAVSRSVPVSHTVPPESAKRSTSPFRRAEPFFASAAAASARCLAWGSNCARAAPSVCNRSMIPKAARPAATSTSSTIAVNNAARRISTLLFFMS